MQSKHLTTVTGNASKVPLSLFLQALWFICNVLHQNTNGYFDKVIFNLFLNHL